MFKTIVVQQFSDNLLLRTDQFLSSLPKLFLAAGIVAFQLLLFYLYFNVGPQVPLIVFFVINFFLAAKYVGSEFSYAIAFMAAAGKTYIKIEFYPGDAVWWQGHWQFISSYSLYTLICYLINSQLASRKRIEAAFDELSRLSEAIVTETDSGVLVFDNKGKCVVANPSVARMLGAHITQLQHCELGRDDALFPSTLLATMQGTLNNGERRQLTVRLGTPQSEVWSVVTIGQILHADSSYLLLVFADISAYKAAQDAAAAALNRAGAAERKLINIGEEVQQRIGRELHDDLGQHLAGVAFMSQVLFQKLKHSGYEEIHDAVKITEMLNEAVGKTRQLSQGLYPEELKEKGFCEMMEKLTSFVEANHQISCEFKCDNNRIVDNPEIAIQLFRISQEAVNNAVRHGHARQINLRITGDDATNILTIEDDGCGFGNATSSQKGGGLGMRTMQHRADLIGATLKVACPGHGGTCVTVQLPTAR